MREALAPVVAAVVILALWVVARGLRTIREQPKKVVRTPPAWVPKGPADYDTLLRAVRAELARNLVGRVDWTRPVEEIRQSIRPAVEHLIDTANPLLNRIERGRLIQEVVDGIKSPSQSE
ncbi:hypothetical protein R5W23_000149 [Gemmata sp. JC673]|uniref:Uncharacterized protein n=1 Tax=Gemmata algarum TaxID=2975278 RepID=A0ABU5ESK5_9BACT|nr:hypothetical protein [Gemmata algarum]MDY3557622.1 hypothetical protein [Gemmata algarum]